MAHILPHAAHGDTLPVVKITPKLEGRGDARRTIGAELTALLTFDNLAPVPIVIQGLDASTLPTPEIVAERNARLDLLMARFDGLTIEFSGGDFGAVRYKGTAKGVTFTNMTPSSTAPTKN